MSSYYLLARSDGTRDLGSQAGRFNVAEAVGLERAMPVAPEHDGATTPLVRVHASPAQTGHAISDDLSLALGLDTGFRLFEIEVDPKVAGAEVDGRSGRSVQASDVKVVVEVPAWWAYGPSGRRMSGFVAKISRLDLEEFAALRQGSHHGTRARQARREALGVADTAINESGRQGAAMLARAYARAAAYRSADPQDVFAAVSPLLTEVAHGLVAADLIHRDDLETLFWPWHDVIGWPREIGEDEPYPNLAEVEAAAQPGRGGRTGVTRRRTRTASAR